MSSSEHLAKFSFCKGEEDVDTGHLLFNKESSYNMKEKSLDIRTISNGKSMFHVVNDESYQNFIMLFIAIFITL